MANSRNAPRGWPARLRERFELAARRPRRHRRQELARLSRAALRHLACRARRGAGQCQAARRRARLYPRAIRRPRLFRFARHRQRDRAARAEDARTSDHHRQRRLRSAVCGRRHRHRAARADDLAWLFYTSGTTGRPKGAMLTHRVAGEASLAYGAEVDPVAPGDAILHAAPMSHGSGLYIMPHVARLGVQVMPESGGFEPEEVDRAVQRLAAHVDVRGADHDQAPGRLSGRLQRGQHPHADLGRRADVCRGRAGRARPLRPASRANLRPGRSADDHHHAVERGHRRPRPSALARAARLRRQALCLRRGDGRRRRRQAGRARRDRRNPVRGDVVMAGYWQNEEATAASLRGGWLHTGDVGVFDAEGYLHLKDRSKDLIISGGSNIYPREVEEVLLTHDAVREVSVIGRPGPRMGRGGGGLCGRRGRAAEALDALCLARIARFKRPKDYVFVDALPKNNYGKILKTELRALDAGREQRRVE